MQAQKQGGLVFFRKRDAVGQRQVHIIGAGQKHPPTGAGEQRLQPPRPVEGKLLFVALPEYTFGPSVFASVAGVKSVLGKRYEKEFTLDWAQRLQPLLACTGWRVVLTRTHDMDLAMSNRV